MISLRRLVKVLIGRDFIARPDCQADYQRFGSRFAGWDLVTDQLDESSVIYSVGVGFDISFDLALIDNYSVSIHAFDPTPRSISWVATQDLPPSFIMHEYGLADRDGRVTFNPPENPDHVSHTMLDRAETSEQAITVPVKRLKTIMNELQHNVIDVLKMDVEGAEYSVIRDMESDNIRPKQLLIEFHHRFPGVGIATTKDAIKRIKKMGYGLYSVSESGEEFSFIYKK